MLVHICVFEHTYMHVYCDSFFLCHSCIARCQSALRKGCTHNLPRKIPISKLWARPLPATLRWLLPVVSHKQVLTDQVHLTLYWQRHRETSDIPECAWSLLPRAPQPLCSVPNTNSQPLPVPPPAMQHPVDPNCSSGSLVPLSQGTMPDTLSLLVDSPSSATYSLGLVATTAFPRQE